MRSKKPELSPKKIVAAATAKKKRKPTTRLKSIKCTDETGHVYDSMLEMDVTHEFETYQKNGKLENLKKQVVFTFERIGFHHPFSTTYTADFTFDCLKDFYVISRKKVKGKWVDIHTEFYAGKSYVIDVKSPKTYNMPTWRMKKKMMLSVWGIRVVELIRSHSSKTTRVSKI